MEVKPESELGQRVKAKNVHPFSKKVELFEEKRENKREAGNGFSFQRRNLIKEKDEEKEEVKR